MSQRKTACLFGDYTHIAYHPLTGVDAAISRALRDDFDVSCTEAYPEATYETLSQFDLIIWYIDNWGARGTRQAAGALIAYVANGGKLLCLHSGIITAVHPETQPVYGGGFAHHPPADNLTYSAIPEKADHPIVQGVEPFTVFDEPYQFSFDPYIEREEFLTYSFEGKDWPAGWTHLYGLGRVVYLSLGHTGEVYENPQAQKLLRNGAAYLFA